MLKYKVIKNENGRITWDVHVFMKPNADVGTFIREIKQSPSHFDKEIKVYRKGIEIANVLFHGETAIVWNGKASEIWDAPVEKCELTHYHGYVFKIYIQEPREAVGVCAFPFFPLLFNNMQNPLPQERA